MQARYHCNFAGQFQYPFKIVFFKYAMSPAPPTHLQRKSPACSGLFRQAGKSVFLPSPKCKYCGSRSNGSFQGREKLSLFCRRVRAATGFQQSSLLCSKGKHIAQSREIAAQHTRHIIIKILRYCRCKSNCR